MWQFYKYLWNKAKGKRKCQICSIPLCGENLSIYHEHLLEKSTWPQFKYEEKNMILICSDCHSLKTNGFPKEIHKIFIENARKELLGTNN